MAIVNGYATLAEMQLRLEVSSDPDLDPLIEEAVEASSRGVDNYTHRHYFQLPAEARTFKRTYSIDGDTVLLFGAWNDLVSIDTVEDDTGDITADVTAWPPNRQKGELWPIRGLVGEFDGTVTVTGDWGWPEIPKGVHEAVILQSTRLLKRRKSPEGVVGANMWGTVKLGQIDPDAKRLVKPYRLRGVG